MQNEFNEKTDAFEIKVNTLIDKIIALKDENAKLRLSIGELEEKNRKLQSKRKK